MSSDAIVMLKEDHKKVKELFREFEAAKKADDKERCGTLVDQICQELLIHAELEEQVFYPMAKQALPEDDREMVFEAVEEHNVVETLIGQLQQASSMDEQTLAKATVLMELVKHHIEEEEDEMFPSVREKLGRNEMVEIGEKMMQMKQRIDPQELVAAAK